jgi:hypothetical protein
VVVVAAASSLWRGVAGRKNERGRRPEREEKSYWPLATLASKSAVDIWPPLLLLPLILERWWWWCVVEEMDAWWDSEMEVDADGREERGESV